MGNRFSTIPQYHSLVTGHGVLAAITFLLIVPVAVMVARFYRGPPGYAVKYHAYLQVLAVGLTTVLFILGFFAVGPYRALTNPHHGIGVAMYVLILLQAIGGRMVRNIRKPRSFRIMVHQWSGRSIAILGIVQVPLGLTLYGSPKVLFILYTLWMTFLLLVYFILSYRREGFHDRDHHHHGGTHYSDDGTSRVEERKRGGILRWLAPLAAGAGIFALLRRRNKKRETSRSRSRSRSQSRSRVVSRDRSRVRSRSGGPVVLASRRGSGSYFDEEKYSEATRRDGGGGGGGGGVMKGLLAAGTAIGAGALISRWMDRRKERSRDDEYSTVATDTPSKRNRLRRGRDSDRRGPASEVTDESDELRHSDRRPHTLPGPGGSVAAGAVLGGAGSRIDDDRPTPPRPSHQRGPSRYNNSVESSEYSSYISPSRRRRDSDAGGGGGGAGKGFLAGLGLGWFAKKKKDEHDRKEEERVREDEERRAGARLPRYTGDGYGSPTRRDSRRRPPASARGTSLTQTSDISSAIEPRPYGPSYGGPPMPPLGSSGAAPGAPVPFPIPIPGADPRAGPGTRTDPAELDHLNDSGSEAYMSSSGRMRRRISTRRRKEGEAAAAAAAATAGLLAAEEEERRRVEQERSRHRVVSPSHPLAAVSVRMHNDKNQRVTLRQLPPEGDPRHRRNSASSLSGGEAPTPTRRRYRRESAQRMSADESAAERAVTGGSMPVPQPNPPFVVHDPLVPPNPPFAGGRRPKDSAYYSGPGAAPGHVPGAGPAGATVSSLGSPASHGTWSGMSPSASGMADPAAASHEEKRRRRRLERQAAARPAGRVEYE